MRPAFSALLPLLEKLGRPSRRTLLRWSALTGLSLALPGKGRAAAEEAGASTGSLDAPTLRTLDAATARILPSGDGPGAREAKVLRFIDLQVAGPLQRLRPALVAGASVLDQWGRKRHALPFAEVEPAAQDRILGELSRGEIPAPGFPQREVFRLLHTLTLEGFLSDPVHGGNHQQVGWRALGFHAPHRRSLAEAQEEDAGAGHPNHAPARRKKLPVVQ